MAKRHQRVKMRADVAVRSHTNARHVANLLSGMALCLCVRANRIKSPDGNQPTHAHTHTHTGWAQRGTGTRT